MNIVNNFKREMVSQYQEYIRDVSPMAPSMKTLELLLNLCVPGMRVLDLGTGFSSYVLRHYAADLDIHVVSVDDSSQWLYKTRDYCTDHGITPSGFHLWQLAMNWPVERFDLVFMDLGKTKNRVNYYYDVLKNFCTEKTLLLCDDMHKPTLKQALEHELKAYDYINIGVIEQTKDEFGRYCKLVFRLRPKQQGA